jgi:5'-methylthioadenosine phosphorylase
MAGILGGHVAGMTGIPEATLAVEAGLRYASISLVANPCAGLSQIPITVEDVNRVLAESGSRLLAIIDEVLRRRAQA